MNIFLEDVICEQLRISKTSEGILNPGLLPALEPQTSGELQGYPNLWQKKMLNRSLGPSTISLKILSLLKFSCTYHATALFFFI
jgi:hypothetical protein